MEVLASLFTSTATSAAVQQAASASLTSSFVSAPAGVSGGSGGFSIASLFTKDVLLGSSQQVPFVGPVVSIFQAFNDERDARSASRRIDFNARSAELAGKAETVSALRTLNDVQAHNVVAAFTSGGGLSGSRGRVIQDVNRDAQLGFDLIRTNAEIKAADLRQTARFIRKTARFERNVAIGKSLFRF